MEQRLPDSLPYTAEAKRFMRERAGSVQYAGETAEQGRDRTAREYAQAEMWARTDGGLQFDWERDVDGTADDPNAEAWYVCARRPGAAHVFTSVGGIDLGPNDGPGIGYGRVIEAELALELLTTERANAALQASCPELRAMLAYTAA